MVERAEPEVNRAMNGKSAFARCLAYLGSQSQPQSGPVPPHNPQHMAVAIARQTGSGSSRIAHKLAEYLQGFTPADERPWTVFDKNLIAQVLEDHHLPSRLAKFLPEEKVNAISDTVDEILGLHPPSWVVVPQTMETILRLAELGNVILVGRGANVITNRLPNVLHIRLVGSLERRVARVQESEHLNRAQALAFIRRRDRGSAHYVSRYFHNDVTDVSLYDLTINTDHLEEDEVVHLIGGPILRRMRGHGGAWALAA
jgi:cytidylate kinase